MGKFVLFSKDVDLFRVGTRILLTDEKFKDCEIFDDSTQSAKEFDRTLANLSIQDFFEQRDRVLIIERLSKQNAGRYANFFSADTVSQTFLFGLCQDFRQKSAIGSDISPKLFVTEKAFRLSIFDRLKSEHPPSRRTEGGGEKSRLPIPLKPETASALELLALFNHLQKLKILDAYAEDPNFSRNDVASIASAPSLQRGDAEGLSIFHRLKMLKNQIFRNDQNTIHRLEQFLLEERNERKGL